MFEKQIFIRLLFISGWEVVYIKVLIVKGSQIQEIYIPGTDISCWTVSQKLYKWSICIRTNLKCSLIENRIYIYREEFTRKKCKTAILLYCFYTAGVLHIFMLYNLLGPGTSFFRKSKIIWPIIISYRLYAFHFTNEDFPL